jgi:TrmH family RNA methyltransferase
VRYDLNSRVLSILLTSPQNPLIKDVRRAVFKGALTEDGYAIAEGVHLVEEAIRSGCDIKAVIAAESCGEARRYAGFSLVTATDALFAGISSTETPQGILALVKPPKWEMDDLFGSLALVLVLDGLQDPGNAGATVRSAEAFGATGVLFLKGTVAPYNPKAIRASAGSVFRLPVIAGVDERAALEALSSRGVHVYAALPDGAYSLADADLRNPCAFIIGSEGRGVSATLREAAREIRIPTANVESLNAGVAAAILTYEARRQRHQDT